MATTTEHAAAGAAQAWEPSVNTTAPPVPAGFAVPDFRGPLDVDVELAAVPASSTAKGMFMNALVEKAARAGKPLSARGPYIAFKDYPDREQVALLAEAARVLHPDVGLREGMRRIGSGTYDTLRDSLIGRVVFGVLGKDVHALAKLAPKVYAIAGKGTLGTLLDVSKVHSHIALDGQVALADCYHYGAFEGVLDFCGVKGVVYFKKIHATRVEFFTTWSPK